MYKPFRLIITVFLAAGMLSACGGGGLSPEEINATAAVYASTIMVETLAALPTNTPVPTNTPQPTFTPLPSDTPTVTPTATMTETPTPEATNTSDPNGLKYWLIREGTGGNVGCGDDLAYINTGVPSFGDPIQDIRYVLTAQFAPKGEYFLGLLNPLHGSSINIEDIYYNGVEYVVISTGYIERGIKGCRWDQIRAVVKQAMRTIPNVNAVEIKMNGRPFNDIVSKDK